MDEVEGTEFKADMTPNTGADAEVDKHEVIDQLRGLGAKAALLVRAERGLAETGLTAGAVMGDLIDMAYELAGDKDYPKDVAELDQQALDNFAEWLGDEVEAPRAIGEILAAKRAEHERGTGADSGVSAV